MKKIFSFLLFIFTLFHFSGIHAQVKKGQECFPKQDRDKLVFDEANILDDRQEKSLEQKLELFAVNSSNEIYVVIVPDLCGMERAQFAIELGELWGAGQKAEDNGIIVLVKPKTAESRGQTFLAIGRGLEAVIPDAQTFLIIDNEMLPRFRNNDMYGGIDAATTTLMQLATGEYNIDTYRQKYEKKGSESGSTMFLIILLVLLFFLAVKFFQVRQYARLNNIGFWAAWTLLNAARSRQRGYWGDFNSGTGGFGGFGGGGSSGGGGFGNFGGGGSFGGGGAGGDW
jgi:uncharacterized protein